MVTFAQQLDKRFGELHPLSQLTRPSRGWIRAIRQALGMTTGQLAKRLGVQQPRIVELERSEATGNITLKSLERAAEAMNCRVVYALVPIRPLSETLQKRAYSAANRQLASVEHSMRLEAQGVPDETQRDAARDLLVAEMLRRPRRLWDEP